MFITKIFLAMYFLFMGTVGVYLLKPSSTPPTPPPGSLISTEPADTESVYRQAYFTSLTRSELMAYYKSHFQHLVWLNHPPEDGYALIRDQTRSSWLEELTNPGKDTLYINGYYPTKPSEEINRNGIKYAAKITTRYIPSNLPARLTVLALITISGVVIIKQYQHV